MLSSICLGFRNALLALGAYVSIVVLSSVAADYSYYRQVQAEERAYQTQSNFSSNEANQ